MRVHVMCNFNLFLFLYFICIAQNNPAGDTIMVSPTGGGREHARIILRRRENGGGVTFVKSRDLELTYLQDKLTQSGNKKTRIFCITSLIINANNVAGSAILCFNHWA